MMNARNALKLLGLLVTGTALGGCGGGSTETAVAPDATAPAASSGRSMAPMDMNKNEGEPTSGSVAGGGYGGGSTGGSSYGSDEVPGPGMGGPGAAGMGGMGMMGMDGYEGESAMGSSGYDMRSMAGNAGKGSMGAPGAMGMPGGMPGGMGSEGEYADMYGGAGYGEMAGMGPSGSGMGMGMGMGGMGGGMNGNALFQFINQNCSSCHGAANPKGGVRLIGVGDVASDPLLWQSVHEQLEAGTMPPASSGLRPDAQQLQLVTSFLKEELSKSGLADQDYLSKAKFFFGSGREQEAIEFFYAHALTVDDTEAQQLLADAQLFAAGKRPVVTLRFAVGIELQAPDGLDVKPIGTSQFGSGGGGAGGMGGGEMGMPGYGGNAGGADKERTLYDLTGDFGKGLVEAFESRWTSGAMGNVFKDATPPVRKPANNSGMGGGFGGPGMPGMGMGMGEDYGMMGGPGAGATGGSGAEERIVANQAIKPGLFYLGTGTRQDLLKKASDAGYDGLFLFDINATQNRRIGTVNTTTSLRAILTDGTVVGSTRPLVNTEVEREKLRGNDEDVVKTNLDRLFVKFDEVVQLKPMPKLPSESARRRIQQLIHNAEVGQLQTLFEARLYHSLGSLTTDELATIYQIVLRGNEGESLATGLAADRKLVMEEVFEQL